MTADVNVTEKAREAALARWALGSSDTTQMLMAVDAALAALADPEVLAGIAGVLREHQQVNDDPNAVALCSCGTAGMVPALSAVDAWHREHVAAAVVELLRGERA